MRRTKRNVSSLAPPARAGVRAYSRSNLLAKLEIALLAGATRNDNTYFVSPSVSELCAEMRCAKKIGRKVMIITNIAATLVTGLSRGRVN